MLGDFVEVLRCSSLSSQGTPLRVAVEADVVVPKNNDQINYFATFIKFKAAPRLWITPGFQIITIIARNSASFRRS